MTSGYHLDLAKLLFKWFLDTKTLVEHVKIPSLKMVHLSPEQ